MYTTLKGFTAASKILSLRKLKITFTTSLYIFMVSRKWLNWNYCIILSLLEG